MQYKQTALRLLLLCLPFPAFSQTTYLPQDAREQILLERMEIRNGHDSILNFSKTKPFSRKQFIPVIERSLPNDSAVGNGWRMSAVDRFNADIALMNSPEWTTRRFTSKK